MHGEVVHRKQILFELWGVHCRHAEDVPLLHDYDFAFVCDWDAMSGRSCG